jgi:hypothetical protein
MKTLEKAMAAAGHKDTEGSPDPSALLAHFKLDALDKMPMSMVNEAIDFLSANPKA